MIALVLVPLFSEAQAVNTKIREVGINLSGPTFGIRYRAGNEFNLLRLTLLSISGTSYNYKLPSNTESKNRSQGLGFNFGYEKRKSISEDLYIYFGSDILASYNRNTDKYDSPSQTYKTFTFSPGLGIILGFIYQISSNINISAEVMPSILYSISKTTNDNGGTVTKYSSSGLNYGLRSDGVNLTISFKLGK